MMKFSIKSMIAKVKSLPAARHKASARALPAVLILAAVVAGAVIMIPSAVTSTTLSPEEYQRLLRTEVDTTNGEPRSGRDPATQQQNSLASAASKPTGGGQPVTKSASTQDDDHSHHDHSSHDNTPPASVASNGCYIDYGIPGEQCLPAHASSNGILTCEGVRKHFPNGITVSGNDRFNLDTNRDKLACGTQD